MAKQAKSDRQKVIDDIRKKQKGAEKRRGFMIVGVCVVVALLIIGAASYRPLKNAWDLRKFNDLGLASIGAAPSACEKVETKTAEGNNDHIPTNTPVVYEDAPPAFGPHWNEFGVAPAPMDRKFYTDADRPELESLVHNLEHGYTVVWYDETIAEDADAITELRAVAKQFPGTDNYRYKFIAAPWTSEDEDGAAFPDGTHVAYTHWSVGGEGETDAAKQVGVWQYCSEFSGEALETFMLDYPYLDSPEPTVE
ncbi:hypothetical protein NPS01_23800 [Nocardioides psychrotolerans]|uniref:DUF3105 domain-containing protein n=1 Tax=Nocardioides psychrotolerans TaxID=1005945 RepID=A0A1I3LFA2_9ACTN|nr:DUF3105 domain-containing protein [Nocardioides psychrotolerans]GEP38717.1 hypothetical protein NPS01_23800 [Nocardioides psychrotolerans]SFI83065.1 Protein of unknown function [Nocardioides psychrotolerans]